jgi:hypothetical protein
LKKNKKKYVKPKVTRIKLDAKTAVLATCKVQGGSVVGPMNVNCRGGGQQGCLEQGS